MQIRFGYAAMSVLLEHNSPSRAVTFKTYSRLAETSGAAALDKVRAAARENLRSTKRLLEHNRAHGVPIYRFSSKIIPLATHPAMADWDYISDFSKELAAVGSMVRENKIRVSFHPDQYTLLNSPHEKVFHDSLADLEYHCRLLEAMALDSRARIVIHIGGGYGDKKSSLDRFMTNWSRIPGHISGRIVLENDDKIFTPSDVLPICSSLSVPMILDFHHYRCHNDGENIAKILPAVYSTWEGACLPPKFHVSSPRSRDQCRSHHDFVNPDDLYPFLKLARELNQDIDIMVEAKQKDRAMFQLVSDLAGYPMIRQAGEAALIIS